jgi:hypothetical protein
MPAERIENICSDIDATIERVLILELLDDPDAPLSRAELARHVSGTRGEPIDIDSAIDGLYTAGLVYVSGELVLPTLAARRIDQLYPLEI